MSKSKSPKTITNGKQLAKAITEVTAKPEVVPTATKKAAAKVAKAVASKPEKKPKEELCVFAIRLTPAERDAVHAAAGPGKATRFVRALIVAAANRDEAMVATILKGVMTTES